MRIFRLRTDMYRWEVNYKRYTFGFKKGGGSKK